MPSITLDVPNFLSRFFSNDVTVWWRLTFSPLSTADQIRADTAIIDQLLRKATQMPVSGNQRFIDQINGFSP